MQRKLLLADDSVTIQRVIELTFADEDIDVIAVGDGQEAIDRIERDRPDIVLADVGMPERDGYEVAEHVKRHPHLAHIPVILLTGTFERVDEGRAQAAGCDAVLSKPFEPQAVIQQVRELLSRGEVEPTGTPAVVPAQGTAPPPSPSPAPAPVPDAHVSRAAPDESAAAAGSSDPLDEYFDRLDAAFATMGTIPTPGEGPPPARPDVTPASFGVAATSETVAVPPTGAAAPQVPAPAAPPSLGDAFAALLAAEQQETPPVGPAPQVAPAPPSPLPASPVARPPAAPAAPGVSDALVEEVTRRVIERISDRVVRETVTDLVLEVAGRLVREEIERIKSEVQ